MSDDNLDCEPSYVEDDDRAYAMALIEQQRSSIIEKLRTSRAASVTVIDKEGATVHWGVFYDDDDGPGPFLLDAAVRAIRDLAAATHSDAKHICRALHNFLEHGDDEL